MYQILLIDDDETILDGLRTVLYNHFSTEFICTTATDGESAIRLMEKNYYHLIISDTKMPKLDGLSLLRILKKHEISSCVIILSGYDDYSYIRSALKTGAYDYLLKPVNINQFVHMIEHLIPSLRDTSPSYLPSRFSVEAGQEKERIEYFDLLPSINLKTEEDLKKELELLRQSVCNMDIPSCTDMIDQIFSGLSEKVMSHDRFQKYLISFVYSIMEHNNSMIQIIAEHKLTRYDISSHIKNIPCCSQLRELFKTDLVLYVKKLMAIQEERNYYMVRKAKDYINAHLSAPLTITDISAQFQFSPYYFSTLFKTLTGMCIRDYIVQQRIEKAKILLQDPEKKIQDIALESGYQDAAHFNRAFKKITGLSPSKYRTFDRTHHKLSSPS